MIDPKIRRMVQSQDASKRGEGIRLLVRIGDVEALKLLAAVYEHESVPEIKDLARKAGQAIQRKLASKTQPKKRPPATPAQQPVTSLETKKAQRLMERAEEEYAAAEYMAAQHLVRQAFELDPGLQQDRFYRELAGDIFGVPADELMEHVLPKREGNLKLNEVFSDAKQSVAAKFGSLSEKKLSGEEAVVKSTELMEQAESAYADVDYAQAQQFVYRAFELNPDLQHEARYHQLLADIFGTSQKRAILLALGDDSEQKQRERELQQFLAEERKEGRELRVRDGLWHIVLLGAFGAVVGFVCVLVIALTLGNRVRDILATGGESYASFVNENYGFLAVVNIPFAFLAALAFFIGISFWMLSVSVSNHLAALRFMDGKGTWVGLIQEMRSPVASSIVIIGLIGTISFSWLVNTDLDYFAGIGTVDLALYDNVSRLLFGLESIMTIAFHFWMSSAISYNYHYGVARGCITIMLAQFVFGVFVTFASFAFLQIASLLF